MKWSLALSTSFVRFSIIKAFPLLPRGVENARDLMRVLLRSDCFIEYTSSNRKRRRRGDDDDDDTKIDFQITPEKQSTEQ